MAAKTASLPLERLHKLVDLADALRTAQKAYMKARSEPAGQAVGRAASAYDAERG